MIQAFFALSLFSIECINCSMFHFADIRDYELRVLILLNQELTR